VNVPPGRGVSEFGSTTVDRRKRTLRVDFDLRRIGTPGTRSAR